MSGNHTAISQDRWEQNTQEDPTSEIQQHFPQTEPTRAQAENMRPPSPVNHQRQAQPTDAHRTTTSFQDDPIHYDNNNASVRRKRHHSETAHSVAPASLTSTAYTAHSVVAVRSVPAQAVNLLSTTLRRRLPVVGQDQDGTSLHINERRLTPYQVIALDEAEAASTEATTATVSQVPAATLVTPLVAVGTGPPGHSPDGPVTNHGTDRRSESSFYRNAIYTRSATSNSAPPPFVLKEPPLAPFDGDVRKYPKFRDRFLDIMEAQPNIEPRYKLMHLLTYLRGEPLRMADRLRLTDENYFTVVDLLEERYGNKRVLETLLLQDLIDLRPLPSTKLSVVTKFHDDAYQIIADLRARKHCPLTNQILLGKFPKELKHLFAVEGYLAGDATAHDILSSLHHLICQRRELSTSLHFPWDAKPDEDPDVICDAYILEVRDAELKHEHRADSSEKIETDHGPQQSPLKPTAEPAAVAVNASAESRLKERRTCPLCGLLHTAFRCTVFRTINGRLRRIQKLKLCLLCLREGHQAATCPRKTKDSCKICNQGPHNRAVCMTANGRTLASNRRRSPARTGSSVDPKRSDQKRRTQKESVNWVDAKRVSTATNLRTETQSSPKGTPKTIRKKKSKKPGAAPSGRDSTPRPLTTSTAESMKPKTAVACGDSRLIPASQGLQPTDRCSKMESTQFDHAATAGGTTRATLWESLDADEKHGLREAEEDPSSEPSEGYSGSQASDSDVSLPSSHGHCRNAEMDDWEDAAYQPRGSNTLQTDAVYVASSTDEHRTTLLECIKATAENPVTGISREVLIFFDSGSTRSFVSTELALDLRMPLERPCIHRVDTFGSGLPTTIEGFSTSVVLRSKHRRLPSLAFTTQDHIVSSIRTALVETSDLPKLRRGELTPSPLQVTPDILIGQDLVSIFKRQSGPPLPSGLYIVNSLLGPMLGGSGKVLTTVSEAATSFNATTAATVVHQPSIMADTTPPSPLLPVEFHRTPSPAHSVGSCTVSASKPNSRHSVEMDLDVTSDGANQDLSSITVEENDSSRSTVSASCRTDRHSVKNSAKGSRQLRKQTNPLDTTAPLPAPPSAIIATLPEELQMDPRVPEFRDQASDCSQQSNVQQNPALTNPRKTRLRRRSSSLDRPVLGSKNHEELRKCEDMRPLLDKQRPAIDKRNHATLDNLDSVCSLTTALEHAASRPFTSKRSQSATRPQSASNGSHHGPKFPSTSERAHSVLRSQHRPKRQSMPLRGNKQLTGATTKEPRRAFEPTLREQTYRTVSTSKADQRHSSKSAYGQSSCTPTGSNQHSTAMTRCVTSHVQGHRRSCIARHDVYPTETHRTQIPVNDVVVKPSANIPTTIYHLTVDLPNRAITACDSRVNFIEDLSTRLHVAPGPARRADHSDQGILAHSRSPALDTAHSVVPVPLSLPHETSKATCRKCAFCDGTHPSAGCTMYQRVNRRMQRLRALKLCFRCLEEGHASSECPERTTSLCRNCNKGQHHLALCRRLQEDTADAVSSSPSTAAKARNIVAPDAAHSVAKEAGPIRRHNTVGHFPPAMNHFRRDDQPTATTRAETGVVPRSAKKLSAAARAPAQEPSSHLSKPRPRHTTANPSGTQLPVHEPSAAERCGTDRSTSAKTSSKQRSQTKSNSDRHTMSARRLKTIPLTERRWSIPPVTRRLTVAPWTFTKNNQ